MKKIVCEMCGNNSLVKKNGVFECQYCGTQYTLEEAKKMMIEGTVNVEGTVKVDNSTFVKKYLDNARRAMKKEDWDEVEKYYNMVEQNDPTNIEAIFYSSYGKAKSSLISNDIYKRKAAFKVLKNSISVLDDNYDIDEGLEQKKLILQISEDLLSMPQSSFVYNEKRDGYGFVVYNDKNVTFSLLSDLIYGFIETLNNISKKYSSDQKREKVFFYLLSLKCIEYLYISSKSESLKNAIYKYHRLINSIKPEHKIPV